MNRIIPSNEARDLLQHIPDTGVEPYTEASFFHEADGEVEFHGVRYTDKRTVDGIAYPVSGCATRAWADLTATAPNLAHTVIQQAEQIQRLQKAIREIGKWEMTAYADWLVTQGVLKDKDMNP